MVVVVVVVVVLDKKQGMRREKVQIRHINDFRTGCGSQARNPMVEGAGQSPTAPARLEKKLYTDYYSLYMCVGMLREFSQCKFANKHVICQAMDRAFSAQPQCASWFCTRIFGNKMIIPSCLLVDFARYYSCSWPSQLLFSLLPS